MEIAVQRGTVAASSKEAAQKMAADRARRRSLREAPGATQRGDGRPWWEKMAQKFPNAVASGVEPVH